MLTKVETVGHVYMAVSGAPEQTDQHASNIADLALHFTRLLDSSARAKVRIGKLKLLQNYYYFVMDFLLRPSRCRCSCSI